MIHLSATGQFVALHCLNESRHWEMEEEPYYYTIPWEENKSRKPLMVDEELPNVGDEVRQESHDQAEEVAEQRKTECIRKAGKEARG